MADMRMNAYYYGFDPTGVEAIDKILSAREVVNGQRFFGNVTIGDVNHLAAALAALPGEDRGG